MFKETKQIIPFLDDEVASCAKRALVAAASREFSVSEKLDLLQQTKESAVKFFAPCIDLSSLTEVYPTAGITEALNSFSLDILKRGYSIHVAPGDYEWIKQFFLNRNESTIRYVSNPSAKDGNYLSDEEWTSIIDANTVVALDCAYMGTAPIKKIQFNDKVTNLFVSCSKTFGLPDLRAGLHFRKNTMTGVKTLTDHGYFSPYPLYVFNKLMNSFSIDYLYSKHQERQQVVCEKYGFKPSDVVFLGTSTDEQFKYFDRAGVNRLCLTELMQSWTN